MGRDLASLPVDLLLYDTYKRNSGELGNVKKNLGPTWRRSIRSVGGFWVATADYEGPEHEQLELFQEGLMRQVVESLGGLTTWRGFIARMELTLNGIHFIRQWETIANQVKAIYSRIGDNQFTNGSAESGAWTAYNTPTTLAQSTVWVNEGTYSCRIVADSANDGATIQTGITIVANKAYDCRVSVNLVSGTWKLEIYRTDTGATLGSTNENTTGDHVLTCSISDSNTYAGTIGVRLFCTTASGEIYGDAAVFQTAPERAETKWYTDTDSQAEYGIIEEVLLLAGESDADANDVALTEKRKRAWPRAQPPDEFGSQLDSPGQTKLALTIYGDVFTMRNKYSTRSGTGGRSTHVTNLVGDSEFVTAGVIESNTRDYKIDDQAPVRIWEILRDITLAGDASGNRWLCGVFGNRKFDYRMADTALIYRARAGRLYDVSGGEVEPWLAGPGLVYLDDLPIGPPDLTGDEADDPHVKWIEEVEFNVAEWLKGGSGLMYRRASE